MTPKPIICNFGDAEILQRIQDIIQKSQNPGNQQNQLFYILQHTILKISLRIILKRYAGIILIIVLLHTNTYNSMLNLRQAPMRVIGNYRKHDFKTQPTHKIENHWKHSSVTHLTRNVGNNSSHVVEIHAQFRTIQCTISEN